MRAYVKTRCDLLADYIIRTGATVRDTAKVFGVSKSTVHKDVTSRLYSFDAVKAKKVSEVLEFNLSERHLRGGTPADAGERPAGLGMGRRQCKAREDHSGGQQRCAGV